jgi:bacteriorhodopsin|tara:strand:- start:701 stop:1474 length:774 start_codon:yes stop_codon:yes gene_type:complete
MRKLKQLTLTVLILISFSSVVNAETFLLEPDIFVGFSFWTVSMVCLAATVFFFLERRSVPTNWRLPITVAVLISGISFVHYIYLRQVVVTLGGADTLILYRYIDWMVTAPLLILQFYFILSAVRKTPNIIFWKLLTASLVMVIAGYMSEADYSSGVFCFIIFMIGWIYILYEIYSGDTGKMAAKSGNKPFITAYNSMRMIVTLGWAIYPLSTILIYLTGSIDNETLNILYNVADILNKIVFCLIIWSAAMKQSGRVK